VTNDDKDLKLIKAITTRMEEYGMPSFTDKYPAMDILQLVKDSGYGISTPQQPSEKKALSRGNIELKMAQVMIEVARHITKEINLHSALPAQREVRYPEYKDISNDRGNTYNEGKRAGFNNAIDEFKKLNGEIV
jgi:hypothetical protein